MELKPDKSKENKKKTYKYFEKKKRIKKMKRKRR